MLFIQSSHGPEKILETRRNFKSVITMLGKVMEINEILNGHGNSIFSIHFSSYTLLSYYIFLQLDFFLSESRFL